MMHSLLDRTVNLRADAGHRGGGNVVRSGFTVPEAAVLVAILVCLLSVIAPFLLNAMERSRQTACVDHLRLLGSGVRAHQEAVKKLPPGQLAFSFKKDKVGRFCDPDEVRVSHAKDPRSGASWVVYLLKYLGEEGALLEWNSKANVVDNNAIALTELPFMYCPSRRTAMHAGDEFSGCSRVAEDWKSGGNDYAACSGSGITFNDEARQTYALTADQVAMTEQHGTSLFSSHPLRRGAFQPSTFVPREEIASGDGLAFVITFAERRIFKNGTGQTKSSDGWAWGGPSTLFSTRFAPHTGLHYDEADSDHPGLINVAMADGRAKQINWNIDLATWQNLGTISQGRAIDHPDFQKW